MLLYQDQFYLRWSKPLEDPAAALQHGLCEAPTFHDARSDLLAVLVRQRQVSRGLSGIISAPIRLYHHQVDTVARVLADPVIRYLLADEVGLGKTIEAGLVIRQVMIDDPDAEVLVLVPSSLVGQWRSELEDRLALGTALEDRRLVVMAHEEVGQNWNLDHFAMVVIDEAHNLLSRVVEGSATHQALLKVPAMLALSATPMRGDLELFRRLLALVDPVAFAGTTEESFRQRLHERERSARDLQVLSSKRASVRQKTAVVESVQAMYAGDQNITDLAAACAASENPLGPEWFDLAEYVRETYRLSRRMIRHRRDGELTDGYAVAGRRPTYIEIDDPGRADVDQFLELFRFELEPGRDDLIYSQAVLHALAGPLRSAPVAAADGSACPRRTPRPLPPVRAASASRPRDAWSSPAWTPASRPRSAWSRTGSAVARRSSCARVSGHSPRPSRSALGRRSASSSCSSTSRT